MAKSSTGPSRNEDERRRDEARNVTLQGQVDELRQALRELASRQVRLEETIKSAEGAAIQNRMLLDQTRQESQQSFQARALDENRTRQYLAELEQRLDDALRPIRSMQAHVGELLDVSRKKSDDTGQYLRRFEEIRVQMEQMQAVGDRNLVVGGQLRDTLDGYRNEIEALRRDFLRNEDGIKIVDQESRRRYTEMSQGQQEATTRMDELRADIAHAGDLIEEVKRSVAPLEPALAEMRTIDAEVKADAIRFNQQAIERHDLLVERLDDQRHTTDGAIAEARLATEARFDRSNERFEELAELYREVGVRLSGLAHNIEQLRLVDDSIRRDLWQLHEQRVRLRLEQAQQELEHFTGQRRQPGAASETVASDQAGARPADR